MRRSLTLAAICTLFFSCTKELSLNTTEISFYSLEEHTITTDGTNVSFSSQNPYVAVVNETTGKVTGVHVGETYIDVVADQGTAKVKVNVVAKYQEITDPILDWYASKGEIKEQIGIPVFDESEDAVSYLYGDVNKGDSHIATIYYFGADKTLHNVVVAYNEEHILTVTKHLAERYQYYMGKDDSYMFGNALDVEDADTLAMMTEISQIACIYYYNPNK